LSVLTTVAGLTEFKQTVENLGNLAHSQRGHIHRLSLALIGRA
jgi:hypothetical protein